MFCTIGARNVQQNLARYKSQIKAFYLFMTTADILLMMLIIEKHFITAYQKTFKIRFDLVTIPMIKGEEVLII